MKEDALRPPETEEPTTLRDLELARILEECLAAMDEGEVDLSMLAGRYPDARDEILPLLEVAQQLRRRTAPSAPLSLQFREELRERLMSHRGAA